MHGGPVCDTGYYNGGHSCPSPGQHWGPNCNPGSGSCSGNVNKFVCYGQAYRWNAEHGRYFWECRDNEQGWSGYHNVDVGNLCDVTVQIDGYAQWGNWGTYQDHMVFYIPGGTKPCGNGCSKTCVNHQWTGCPQKDCAGTCGGSATYDCAGICNGSTKRDCAGICGGSTSHDCAGVCGGTAHPDCAGICNGSTPVDCAGICDGDTVVDCNGTCGGSTEENCLGVCGGPDPECCPGDTKTCDTGCGEVECGNDGTFPDCPVPDCDGTCGGSEGMNCLGECGPEPECCPGDEPPVDCGDCAMECVNGSWPDQCPVPDCNGDCGGSAVPNCIGSCDGTCPDCCPGDSGGYCLGEEVVCQDDGTWSVEPGEDCGCKSNDDCDDDQYCNTQTGVCHDQVDAWGDGSDESEEDDDDVGVGTCTADHCDCPAPSSDYVPGPDGDGASGDKAGCGCATSQGSSFGLLWLALMAGALWVTRRRRRSR